MNYTLTQKQKEELTLIGNLYRETIYDSSIVGLPNIVLAFGNGLKEINGDISSGIISEVFRFHKLISSDYCSEMRYKIDVLYQLLKEQLPLDCFFTISCRQKAWESTLKKVLKYYFQGASVILFDMVAFRIIIDSNLPEKRQEEICHQISNICIDFFRRYHMCTLMPPSIQVGNNPLIKDYIDYPKPNGYKSIHLAFMDINNNIFEIQIRTQEMDINAEYGPEEKNEENNEEDNLNHNTYKDNEYEQILPYIFFDAAKVKNPFFRYYKRKNPATSKFENIIVDKIGLKYAKHIEERAHTYY